MSEFSMMTKQFPWPVAYSLFMAGLAIIGGATYQVLRYLERRSLKP
jgi:magnesium transporter